MAGGSRQTDLRHLVRGVFGRESKDGLLTLNLLRQHWPNVVGPELGARTHPHRMAGSTLTIAAPDACWAYELQFFKPELLASVQAFLESRAVSELRFQVAPLPSQPAQTAPGAALPGQFDAAPATAPETPPAETPPALAKAAAVIGDPALRAVFERSLAKQRRGREAQEAAAVPGRPHSREEP